MIRLLSVVAVQALLMAGGGGAKSPTPTTANSSRGTVAFALSSRIETLDLVTRRVRVITSGLDDLPQWSPDGSRLAFVRGRSGMYVVRGDGSGVRRVLPMAGTSPMLANAPQWSPDGSRIAFDRWSDVECTLTKPFNLRFSVARIDGRGSREISALPAPSTFVELGGIRWSPDGRRLLYVVNQWSEQESEPGYCGKFVRSDLYTINANGSGRRRIDTFVTAGSWSPDGGRIAEVDCADQAFSICEISVVNADGGGKKVLLRDSVSESADIAWLPTGGAILTVETHHVYLLDLGTRKQRVLAAWPGHFTYPGHVVGFSRSGRRVAVATAAEDTGNRELAVVIPFRGGRVTRVSLPPAGVPGLPGGVSVFLP